MNRKNNVLKNSVILISREEHSRQRAGRVQQAFGSRTDPCEGQQASPQGWKDGAGVRVTWTRSEGLLGQGHVGPGCQQGQGTHASAGVQGVQQHRGPESTRGLRRAERALIRPSHALLPLGKLKPKEDSVFPKVTVPLSRVHAPSKSFICLGSEFQIERMRIRNSGFCVTRSGVLVS